MVGRGEGSSPAWLASCLANLIGCHPRLIRGAELLRRYPPSVCPSAELAEHSTALATAMVVVAHEAEVQEEKEDDEVTSGASPARIAPELPAPADPPEVPAGGKAVTPGTPDPGTPPAQPHTSDAMLCESLASVPDVLPASATARLTSALRIPNPAARMKALPPVPRSLPPPPSPISPGPGNAGALVPTPPARSSSAGYSLAGTRPRPTQSEGSLSGARAGESTTPPPSSPSRVLAHSEGGLAPGGSPRKKRSMTLPKAPPSPHGSGGPLAVRRTPTPPAKGASRSGPLLVGRQLFPCPLPPPKLPQGRARLGGERGNERTLPPPASTPVVLSVRERIAALEGGRR